MGKMYLSVVQEHVTGLRHVCVMAVLMLMERLFQADGNVPPTRR